ncbi:MAG: MmcQ/YjbR family DNA-binding protein [Verrucomicrobiota bacterium]
MLQLSEAEADKRQTRLLALVEALPEATARGDPHLSLEVRRKRFGWLLRDHHGDGRLALHCRAPRSIGRELAHSRSAAYHIPRYVGQHGWVGYWLDLPKIDWDEVRAIVTDAYRATAPKKLLAQMDGAASGKTS